MQGIRRHLTYANVMATVAVFAVLGGGAYAVTTPKKNSVTSKSVKNDSLKGVDIREATLSLPTGPKGDKGDQGVPGSARAWGVVNDQGTLLRAFGVAPANVRRAAEGIYCITVPGIPNSSNVLIAAPDRAAAETLGGDNVQPRSNAFDCSQPEEFEVSTFNAAGTALDDAGFTFVVP